MRVASVLFCFLVAFGTFADSKEMQNASGGICKSAGQFCVNRETSSGVCHAQEATESPLGVSILGPYGSRKAATAAMCSSYDPGSTEPKKCSGVAPAGVCDRSRTQDEKHVPSKKAEIASAQIFAVTIPDSNGQQDDVAAWQVQCGTFPPNIVSCAFKRTDWSLWAGSSGSGMANGHLLAWVADPNSGKTYQIEYSTTGVAPARRPAKH